MATKQCSRDEGIAAGTTSEDPLRDPPQRLRRSWTKDADLSALEHTQEALCNTNRIFFEGTRFQGDAESRCRHVSTEDRVVDTRVGTARFVPMKARLTDRNSPPICRSRLHGRQRPTCTQCAARNHQYQGSGDQNRHGSSAAVTHGSILHRAETSSTASRCSAARDPLSDVR